LTGCILPRDGIREWQIKYQIYCLISCHSIKSLPNHIYIYIYILAICYVK